MVLQAISCFLRFSEQKYQIMVLQRQSKTITIVVELRKQVYIYSDIHSLKKWILNGGDIFRLQQMLGHSSLDMVKRYVAMFREDLKRDFDTFSPLDNMDFTYEPKKSLKLKRP